MLARLERELPTGPYTYEPKWDGLRALVFRDGQDIELMSRNQRPLARYFPEVVAALATAGESRFVADGELLVGRPDGFDFAALLARLHPAPSRVARLSRETPAVLVLFDVLALGGRDLRERPYGERRAALRRVVPVDGQLLAVTPATDDRAAAQAWLDSPRPGIDGVVAKRHDLHYEHGVRAMVKVKRQRTMDCVVGGFRVFAGRPAVSSLLLGLYRDAVLEHIGIAASFTERQRREFLVTLWPIATQLAGHPWAGGYGARGPVARLRGAASSWQPELPLDWIPVRPQLVAEVDYDHLERGRLRHPARFRRWRPDRTPQSCTFDQIPGPLAA